MLRFFFERFSRCVAATQRENIHVAVGQKAQQRWKDIHITRYGSAPLREIIQYEINPSKEIALCAMSESFPKTIA